MSDPITINEVEYQFEDLAPAVQVMINRVVGLKHEVQEMAREANEKQVVIEAYNNAIVAAVEAEDESAPEAE